MNQDVRGGSELQKQSDDSCQGRLKVESVGTGAKTADRVMETRDSECVRSSVSAHYSYLSTPSTPYDCFAPEPGCRGSTQPPPEGKHALKMLRRYMLGIKKLVML
eukprot:765272-Hanusia_phi.AAC.6